jgi:hypothetical protein
MYVLMNSILTLVIYPHEEAGSVSYIYISDLQLLSKPEELYTTHKTKYHIAFGGQFYRNVLHIAGT